MDADLVALKSENPSVWFTFVSNRSIILTRLTRLSVTKIKDSITIK